MGFQRCTGGALSDKAQWAGEGGSAKLKAPSAWPIHPRIITRGDGAALYYGALGPTTTAFRNNRFGPRQYPRKFGSCVNAMTRPAPARCS